MTDAALYCNTITDLNVAYRDLKLLIQQGYYNESELFSFELFLSPNLPDEPLWERTDYADMLAKYPRSNDPRHQYTWSEFGAWVRYYETVMREVSLIAKSPVENSIEAVGMFDLSDVR